MDPLPPNTDPMPPALRALALSLLIETVVPLLNRPRQVPGPPGPGERDEYAKAELWQALRGKCDELSALVLRADDPDEAAEYVLGYLPRHLEYVFEQLFGRKQAPILGAFKAAGRLALWDGGHDADPA